MKKFITFNILCFVSLIISNAICMSIQPLQKKNLNVENIFTYDSAMLINFKEQSKNSIGTVILDPGHGGNDGGSIGNGFIEKEITLSITKKIGKYLDEKNIEVIYTRDSDAVYSNDIETELSHRVNISNQNDCDAFISIHLNSSEENVSGFEIWSSFSDLPSYSLAQMIHTSLLEVNYTNPRELKNQDDSNLYVLNFNAAPSVLIELGFITSQRDMSFLGNEQTQEIIAKKIASSIIEYIQE